MASNQHLLVLVLVFVSAHYSVLAEFATGKEILPESLNVRHKRSSYMRVCSVKITDLQYRQPVFISEGSPPSLMVPRNGYLTWLHGQTSRIACFPSKNCNNKILGTNGMQFAIITCENGVFRMENRRDSIDIRQTACECKSTGNYRSGKDNALPCPKSTYQIGFDASPNGEFARLFYSCFDELKFSTLYSNHTLYGHEFDHKYKPPKNYAKDDPEFKVPGFSKLNINDLYKRPYQISRLKTLFLSNDRHTNNPGNVPSSAEAEAEVSQLINDRHFLVRGHLNPKSDHLFSTWMWSTFFNVNTAPMWQSINAGNWARLEDNVRAYARNTRQTLEIITGTYDTLAMYTTHGRRHEFNLSDRGVPVPKYFWKIVSSSQRNEAIAFVVSNNPHRDEPMLCDLGYDLGWGVGIKDINDIQKGKVRFCSVGELKRVINFIPNVFGASTILRFK